MKMKEEEEFLQYTRPQHIEREIHTLEGILKGIAIDGKVTPAEVSALDNWCSCHAIVSIKSPFKEIIPLIRKSISDGCLDEGERDDILWLCQRFSTPNSYFTAITSDMQRLHAILGGIAADGIIELGELNGLQQWLEDHAHLKGYWPFDEIDSLIVSVLADGCIGQQEQRLLLAFCSEFLSNTANLVLQTPIEDDLLYDGVCAACPEITFPNKVFCFTGRPSRGSKTDMARVVMKLRGVVTENMRKDVNYLIVGSEGSRCWAFSCYGRKVETAVKLRRDGVPVQIIHESDFWDAVESHIQ